jgi:hypothetical protein
MKALKINNVVPTNMGFDLPSGSLLVIDAPYAASNARSVDGLQMRAQVAVSLYSSVEAYEAGTAEPVSQVSNIPKTLVGAITVEDYEGGKSMEATFVAMAQALLEALFPAKSEIVDVAPRLPKQPA